MRGETQARRKKSSPRRSTRQRVVWKAPRACARARGKCVARAESPRLADCKRTPSEKLQLFQARGNLVDGRATKRTLSRGKAADLAARRVATTSQCDGNSNRGGEEGDGHVQPRVRGVRDRGFASPGKATNILYLDVDPRGIHHADRRQKSSPTCSRCATRIRGRHSDAPARRPCPICSRITSSTPSRSRARGAARSTGHWLKHVLPRLSYLR